LDDSTNLLSKKIRNNDGTRRRETNTRKRKKMKKRRGKGRGEKSAGKYR
jgi:hypothetical protein